MPRTRSLWSDDPRKLRLMQWLTTPRNERSPSSQDRLATELNVHPRSIRDWMSDPVFREAWEREAKNVVGDPDRVQNVLDELYRAAIDSGNKAQVQAAKLYLEATNSIKPAPIEITVSKPHELSDEQLDELLAQGAAQLRQERNAGEVGVE
jgi:hypothetical protein